MESYGNPIKSVFICHFHCTLGPKIMYQVPKDYVSKETFETLLVYLIPKNHLLRRTVTVTTKKTKVVGYPIRLHDSKYSRNMFYFNVCFVFDHKSHTLQYEAIIKKFANFFYNLETENMFLSKSEQSPDSQKHILSMLSTVLNDLNSYNKCTVSACDIMVNLCLIEISSNPPIPTHFDVPLFKSLIKFNEGDWDLASRQVASYINGVNHIAKIAELTKLDLEVVSACVQNLIYFRAVLLVDLFRYSNMYICTTKIGELARHKSRYDEAINAISRPNGPKATLKDIFKMFSAMRHGCQFIDVCLKFDPVSFCIDERNLVLYGLANGYIRHLKKYPVVLKQDDVNETNMDKYYNGENSLDTISNYTSISLNKLDKEIEKDLRIVSIWK